MHVLYTIVWFVFFTAWLKLTYKLLGIHHLGTEMYFNLTHGHLPGKVKKRNKKKFKQKLVTLWIGEVTMAVGLTISLALYIKVHA